MDANAGSQVHTAGMYWGDWSVQACVRPRIKEWAAKLFNAGDNWEKACATMPVKWRDGTIFPAPMRCSRGVTGMYGYVWIQDEGCIPSWGNFRDDGCNPGMPGYRTYKSILWGVPSSDLNQVWCESFGTVINGVTFSTPNRWEPRCAAMPPVNKPKLQVVLYMPHTNQTW